MKSKQSVGYLCFSAICFAFASAVFSLTKPSNTTLFFLTRISGFVCAIFAAILAVMTMKHMGQELSLENFGMSKKRMAPEAPILPAEASVGSLRGAIHALPGFSEKLPNEFCRWQVKRAETALNMILEKTEQEGATAAITEFSTRYLPSAMQFVAACAVEGCPKNGEETLAHIAVACEKQQDAMMAENKASFEQEYRQLRDEIQKANFCWKK